MVKGKVAETGIVAYVRVSTGEQSVSGLGLEAQRASITSVAKERGLRILEWHEDAGLSGKSLNRPGLNAALAAVAAGRGTVLMAAKLDRLSRSVHDATGLMQRADKEGWSLVALDAKVDSGTPQGKVLTNMLMVFAEFERDLIGQRTRDALAAKRAQGIKLGRPRVIDDGLAERIRAERGAGATWDAIAQLLNAEGVPTARGGTWFAASVRKIAIRDEPSDGPH